MKFVRIKAGEKAEVIELEGDEIGYEDMKKYLEIDSPMTVVERKVGDEYYDLWVDDEGLLKDPETRFITGVLIDTSVDADEILVGNMLILRHDRIGRSIGLSEEDIKNLLKPDHIIDNDKFARGCDRDVDEDRVIHYFDGQGCILKAHSQWLVYGI